MPFGARGGARGGDGNESSPAERLASLCSGEPVLEQIKMSGVAVMNLKQHAAGKPVLYQLSPFSRWAQKLHAYEEDARTDPVPSGWREHFADRPTAPAGHDKGPTFTPKDGRSMGGPSAAMREAVGTLEDRSNN